MDRLADLISALTYDELLKVAADVGFTPHPESSKFELETGVTSHIIKGGREEEFLARLDSSFKVPAKRLTLFNYQIAHKALMIEGLTENITFLNASETGTGKTYKTLSFAETDRRPLFVVCPKSMLLEWYLLAIRHKVEIVAICNYETLIKGKMYEFKADCDLDNLPRIDCPYIVKSEEKPKQKGEKAPRGSKQPKFKWVNLPERTVVVFDEAHFCKNIGTQRTELLTTLYDYASHPENRWRNIRILLLSATIIEKRDNLRPFMYVLGYAKSPKDKTIIDSPEFSIREFGRKLKIERRMTRATMREAREALGDDHHSDIRTKMFKLNEKDRQNIERLCQEIREILTARKDKKHANPLAKRLALRQEIEAIKIGVLFSELKEQRSQGYSVVVFVNFKPSLSALQTLIGEQMPNEKYAVIVGGQSAAERLKQTEMFQEGQCDILLSMITAGGVGISLHDTKGGRPRYGLISPPESATQTIQALGRLDRIGAKTNSVQRIIFVADTIEDKIAASLEKKIQTIGDLNDSDDADNLFLYEVYHQYEPKVDPEAQQPAVVSSDADQKISMKIDKTTKKIAVSVPNYMVDAFENGIPPKACLTMKVIGDKYMFGLEHYASIREYLTKLNV